MREGVSGLRLLMVVWERMLMMVMFMRLLVMVVVIFRLRGWWRRMMIRIMCGSTLVERWLAGRNDVGGCLWTKFAFNKVLNDLGDLELVLTRGSVSRREWGGLSWMLISVLWPARTTQY